MIREYSFKGLRKKDMALQDRLPQIVTKWFKQQKDAGVYMSRGFIWDAAFFRNRSQRLKLKKYEHEN